jgi:hypothetical protein
MAPKQVLRTLRLMEIIVRMYTTCEWRKSLLARFLRQTERVDLHIMLEAISVRKGEWSQSDRKF